MSLIEFNNVSFTYPNGFSAVEDIDFHIEKGENIAIVGQNGAGKTTMVKMMNGLLKPTSGKVVIDGMDTCDFTTARLSRKTGYVFQNPDDQIFHNTVRQEIEFGPSVLGYDAQRVKELTEYTAKLVGLSDELEENPYNLPLSIRKFVTIASVIAMDTEIIVLDEPTAGQDIRGIRILENMIEELKEKGKTIITITHDMEFVVNNFDKVFVMAHKNLLKVTEPKEVFSDSALLEESMLKRPYISEIVWQFGLPEHIILRKELAEYIVKTARSSQKEKKV